MKYVVFAVALLGILPAAAWCAVNRRAFGFLAAMLVVPVLAYVNTSINPISFEWYRGTSRGYEIFLAHLFAFAVMLALLLRQKRISFAPDFGAWLYLAYFAWSCVSLVNSVNPLYSGAEIWKMAMVLCVFAASYSYLCAMKDATPLMVGFAIVLVGMFFQVVRQHFGGIWQVRGPFAHQNTLAMFLVMSVPVFFAYYLNVEKGPKALRWLFVAAFFLGSGCLIRTYSRGAIACYPIACGLVLGLSLLHDFKMKKIFRLVPLGILGLCGFLLILPRVISRFENAPKSSGQTRVEFARVARNMIKDQPIFGVGLNNWGIKVNPPYPYWKDTGRSGAGDDGIVETVYLLVCAECRIPGFLLMVAWYLYNLLSCLRLAKRLAGTAWFYLPVGIAGGLTGCYLQSCLEWVLKQSVTLIELVLLFSVVSFLNVHWKSLLGDGEQKPADLPKRKRTVVPHHLQLDPVEHED